MEEAGGGPGRARPWRLTSIGMHFGDSDDPAARLAARGLSRLLRERYLARVQEFYDSRGDQPREWQEVGGGGEFILHVTPEELRAVQTEITAVMNR